MTYVDELQNSTHEDIATLARKHGSFETFLQDVQRMADRAWHNVRSQGHDPSSIVGDVNKTVDDLEKDVTDAEQALATARKKLQEAQQPPAQEVPQPAGDDVNGANAQGDGGSANEPAEGAQVTPGPTDSGDQVTQPAEPASPVSDAGFPTSNVDVSQPVESKPVS